jgi:hypothetical protein
LKTTGALVCGQSTVIYFGFLRRTIMRKKLIYLISFALVLIAVPPAAHAQVDNLILNPSFEEDEVILNDSGYEHWWTWGYEDGLNSTAEIDETEFIDGAISLKINPIGNTNWYFIVAYSPIPLQVGTNYTASFWAKAEEPRPLGAKLKPTDNSNDGWGWTDFELTTEWAEYTFTSEATNAEAKIEFHCAGVEAPLWLDFVYVYEGEYVAGIEPGGIASPEKSARPEPADGAILEQTWATLSWTPGAFAVSHDVYLGDNFADVDAGTPDSSVFQGNQNATFLAVGFPGFPYPDGLIPGTTYYWRVDEVNDNEPNSPWKGDIWSFMIAPQTAYNPDPADAAESINVNPTLSWTPGFGAKMHTIYFGDNFDDVNNAGGGTPQGNLTYTPGPLELAKTYYWRVDEFDAVDTYKGEVWSFTTEGAVGSPNPANGAVDVKQTPTLTWVPGVFAASHQAYFGSDKEAVRNADTSSPEYKGTRALGSETYDPGKLEWDSTYYWRIDEVNNANPDSPWKGNVWSFITANFLVIDDFEDYDIGNNEIWWAWIDGLGYASHPTLPAHPGNGTGSMVGDETTGSYMEETIVHGGGKSMPVFYDNNQQDKLKYSEVELTLTDSRDWTENGVNRLTIWFRGNPDNAAEPLYVALNGSAVVTNDNPEAAQATRWTEWNIDLQLFANQGVNLANVNTLALGLGNKNNPLAGGSGTMYFDDIRLYPPPSP